jgi:hypothetical protein
LSHQKVEFLHEKYTYLKQIIGKKNIPTMVQKPLRKAENQVYLQILDYCHAPGSGTAFPRRIRIQGSQMNADKANPDPYQTFESKLIFT